MKRIPSPSPARTRRLGLILLGLLHPCVLLGTESATSNWQHSSEYVSVSDGTRLAIDCYRPGTTARSSTQKLPIVWRFTPYGRRLEPRQGEMSGLPSHGAGLNGPDALERLLRGGYGVCVADVRGYGASFGTRDTWLGLQDGLDARDITDWLAARPWSNGQIGMMGLSYLGSVQFLAAARASPHLRAVFIAMGQFDHYDTTHENGRYRGELAVAWQQIRDALDFPGETAAPGTVTPVHDDHDRTDLLSAGQQHRANRTLDDQLRGMEFRDSADPETGTRWHIENSPWHYLSDISKSGVAIYHWTGWWDAYARGQLLAFANLPNPQKLHIGPYYHSDRFGVDVFTEATRWFDHHLKGASNGIMDEPPVRFFIAGDDPSSGWRTADQWPLENTQQHQLFLRDERLDSSPPSGRSGTATMNILHDWSLGNFLERNNGTFRSQTCSDRTEAPPECYADSGFPDLANLLEPGTIEFTTAPLERDVVLVGHPVARIWVATGASDADLIVLLSEVEPDGTARLVSDGSLRLSHRALGEPPFKTGGVPWLTNLENDARPMTASPTLITLDLDPIGNRFEQGHRIRLTVVATADKPENPESLGVLYGTHHRSVVELPVIPGDQ